MLGKSQGIIMDSPPTAISLRRICGKYQQNTDADAESLQAKTSLHTWAERKLIYPIVHTQSWNRKILDERREQT